MFCDKSPMQMLMTEKIIVPWPGLNWQPSVLSPGGLLKYDLGRDVPLRLEK